MFGLNNFKVTFPNFCMLIHMSLRVFCQKLTGNKNALKSMHPLPKCEGNWFFRHLAFKSYNPQNHEGCKFKLDITFKQDIIHLFRILEFIFWKTNFSHKWAVVAYFFWHLWFQGSKEHNFGENIFIWHKYENTKGWSLKPTWKLLNSNMKKKYWINP